MKKLALMLAVLPALALAQGAPAQPPGRPPGGPPRGGAGDAPVQRAEKRMRLAATLGLAEALDLDEAGALRVRDLMAKYGEKRAPVQRQIRDNVRILRDAAQGDQAAAGQVDAALNKLRDARTQRQQLDFELLQQVTQGLSPDKKARAALFLARFRERAQHLAMRGGFRGHGPGMGPGMMGPGGGMGPGPRHTMDEGAPPAGPGSMRPDGAGAFAQGPAEPDLEAWFGDE